MSANIYSPEAIAAAPMKSLPQIAKALVWQADYCERTNKPRTREQVQMSMDAVCKRLRPPLEAPTP